MIGTPYTPHGRTAAGVDCWGMVYLAYQNLGISLPSFSSEYPDPLDHDRSFIEDLVDGQRPYFTEVHEDDAEQFDIILFNFLGAPSHVAMFHAPGRMINADSKAGVVLESYTAPRWCSRLVGFYRYTGGKA